MYLAQIELQNVGPIEVLRLDFPFTAGTPQPLILVGENGTGKSLVLAYIVNSLLSFKQTVYENVEEAEKVTSTISRFESHPHPGCEHPGLLGCFGDRASSGTI